MPAHEPEIIFNPWTHLGSEMQFQIPLSCIIPNGICEVGNGGNEGNLTVNGISFQKRSFKQPPSKMAFSLHRKYSHFKSCFGASNDPDGAGQNCDNENGKIKFQVSADEVPIKINEKIWITTDMTKSPVCFLVGVGNVNVVEIKIQYHSHPNSCGLMALIDSAVFPKSKYYKKMLSYAILLNLLYTNQIL